MFDAGRRLVGAARGDSPDMTLSESSRLQCRDCGAHTDRGRCGNCLSRDLGPIDKPMRLPAAGRAALSWHGRRVSRLDPHWMRSHNPVHF